ncbi:unnamed protein product [Rotaria sordida]|uniref:U-box domain-containing protein n=1 Tax=Rotaria sordida TaxID=392033 RepID=A0A814FYU1_9BILA|nr:unnamed protein product [Rotaria sordida]
MADLSSSFLCPITRELMTDPVIDPDGNSYERSAIEDWLKQHSTSPITRTPLRLNDLRPNRALRESIEEYRNKQSSSNTITKSKPITIVNNQSFDLKVTSSWLNDFTHISIQPPEGIGIRAPCDICCVVDTSGSMSTNVEIQGTSNDKESCVLSQLDLVKHALKTIIHSLTQNDRLSIVSFADCAVIVFELHQMDDDGRSNALAALEKLDENGSTNLWDGLKTGVDVLVEGQRTTESNIALFLLTDGCPNVEPPDGYLPALAEYKTKTNFTCSINTFGFGYNLDSKLLEDLAQVGNCGSYAFIPDGSFVGTIFVNAISNLLTTVATNLQLSIGGIQPALDSSSNYICNYSTNISNHKLCDEPMLCLNLGSITFGQSKDVVIPMTMDQYKKMEIILDYESPQGQKKKQCKSLERFDGDIKLLNQQKYRLELVDIIRKGYELLRGSEETFATNQQSVLDNIETLEQTIKNHSTNDNYLTDLLTDLTGQIKTAFSRYDWFVKWGIHYLPSITRAHLLQQCNNFKDPGVQHYGQGQLFNTVRDEMDAIFCDLPAPKRAESGAPIDMSVFNNSDDPCFHGSCTVKLFDGSIKFVKDLRRGDRLYPHGGTINYILKTICNNRQAQMVLLDSGLIITPWHPIRLNGVTWVLPCSLVSCPTNIICEAVYSFALDQGHTIWVNDIECVTLGHGFKEDIVRHIYYGSERVIEDLRIMDGQQNCTGFIEIQSKWVIRNKRTGLVNGIRQPENIDIISN